MLAAGARDGSAMVGWTSSTNGRSATRPWWTASSAAATSRTVHLGPMRESPRPRTPSTAAGGAERPFVLLVQPTIADPRARPPASTSPGPLPRPQRLDGDATGRSRRRSSGCARLPGPHPRPLGARRGADGGVRRRLVGGDVNGGVQDVRQLLFRPSSAGTRHHARSRALPLLLVHAAGRRRPRHERRPRRARGGAMASAPVGGRRPGAWRLRAVASGLLVAILFVGTCSSSRRPGRPARRVLRAPASSSPPVARASPSPGFSC